MGKSDEYQFDYLDDNERFADQVNGALFQGRWVIKPGELEPADAQAVYLGKESGVRKNVRTVVDYDVKQIYEAMQRERLEKTV